MLRLCSFSSTQCCCYGHMTCIWWECICCPRESVSLNKILGTRHLLFVVHTTHYFILFYIPKQGNHGYRRNLCMQSLKPSTQYYPACTLIKKKTQCHDSHNLTSSPGHTQLLLFPIYLLCETTKSLEWPGDEVKFNLHYSEPMAELMTHRGDSCRHKLERPLSHTTKLKKK